MNLDQAWYDGFIVGYIQGGFVIGVLTFFLTKFTNHAKLHINWISDHLQLGAGIVQTCRWCGCKHPASTKCS